MIPQNRSLLLGGNAALNHAITVLFTGMKEDAEMDASFWTRPSGLRLVQLPRRYMQLVIKISLDL